MQDGSPLSQSIKDQILDTGGFTRTPIPRGDSDIQTLTPADSYDQMINRLNKISSKNTQTPGGVVPLMPGQVDTTGRYPKQIIGADNEELYAQGQSRWNKFGNAFVKMLGTAGSTFLQGTIGMVDGAAEWATTGDMSKLYNNEVNRGLTDWAQGLENKLPNYYTHKELDSKWYSSDNLLTANFWFDKVMKNLGFSLGAAAGGFAWGMALKGIGLTSSLIRAGVNMDEVAAGMESTLSKIPQAERSTAAINYLTGSVKQAGAKALAGVLTKSDRIVTAAMGTFGEASMEAIQNMNQFKDNAVADYKRTHFGIEPEGEDLKNIEENANHVGNWSFGLNSILLTGTNYIQFPRILNSSYRAEKSLMNEVETQPIINRAGKFVSGLPEKGFAKKLVQARNLGGLLFNPTEAFEEGAQNVIQEGTQDFFGKSKDTKGTGFWESLGVGVDRTLNTKNGIEQILIGGLSGALQTSGILPFARIPIVNKVFGGESKIAERGATGYGGERAKATNEALEALNRTTLANVIKDNVDSFNRAQVIQEEREAAVRQGDVLEANDKEFDFAHNYIYPRLKYGKGDFINADIDRMRQQASIPEEFDKLKVEGYAAKYDTPQSFIQRLSNLEQHTATAKSLYEKLNVKYGGKVDDKGNRLYTPEVIDKLVYAQSKVRDYDRRVPLLSTELMKAGVEVQGAIDSIYTGEQPNEEATRDALAQINGLKINKDEKDALKQSLQDVLEMSMRRRSYLTEYNRIASQPQLYKDRGLSIEDIEQPEITLNQINGGGPTKMTIGVGEEYYLKNPVIREGNTLTPNPKLTVLSQTLGGEFEVKLPNGQKSFLTKQQLENYQITANTTIDNPKINEILDKAVDKVLGKEKYKDLTPPADNKLEYVNSLNNPALIDDILEEANKTYKEIAAKRAQAEKELKDLQDKKENLEKLQKAQKNSSINTGDTDNIDADIKSVEDSDESKKKAVDIVFSSTTSASEDDEPDNSVTPRVVRERNFLYNQTMFPDNVRDNLKIMLITVNSEKAMGLEGLTKQVYQEDKNASEYKIDDENKGVILGVYVVDKGGYYHFVNEKGKLIGEVGKKVDRNDIVVSTLPSTDTTWRNSKSRFREQDQDQAESVASQWREKRKQIFASKTPTPFAFNVSRGIPAYDTYEEGGETKYRENSPKGTLFDANKAKQILTSQQVIRIADTENITHQGINYPTKRGFVYFEHRDRFAPLNNRKFSKEEVDSLYKIIHRLAVEKGQAERLRNYLRNVLYFSDSKGSVVGRNQIWVDPNGLLNLGRTGAKVPFTPTGIEENEALLKGFLASVYNNTNNQTLEKQFNEPFEEITDINSDGTYVARQWDNYQTFLLENEYKGQQRKAYLGTPVRSISSTVPGDRNFKQKYAILQGLEYKVREEPKETSIDEDVAKIIADSQAKTTKKAPEVIAVPKESVEFRTSQGEILYYTPTKEVGRVELAKVSDYKKAIARILGLKLERVANFVNEGLSPEDAAKLHLETAIAAAINQKKEAQEPKKEEPKKLSTPKDDASEFRTAPDFSVERMGEQDWKEFRAFMEKNLPQFTVEEMTQILKTATNRSAWGKLERDTISLYSAAEKGTGYHEAFEAVWKYFVTPEQQRAISEEFQARPGVFKTRETGETVPYPDATEHQMKEKLADEFADYKVGKKTSIGQAIKDFFNRIVKFFRTFLKGYKPNTSLVDSLFKQIETGEYAEYRLPKYLDNSQEYQVVPGLSVAQVNGYVQDITARFMFELLREGADLMDADEYNRNDIFDTLKDVYEEVIPQLPYGEQTWNELVSKTKDYLNTYSIRFDEQAEVSINDENAERTTYNSSEEKMRLDVKKTQPFGVKMLVGTLFKTQPELDSTGQSVKQKGIVGNYQLLSPSRTTITLLESLSKATSINDLANKLRKLANENNDYVRLINRLGKRDESGHINFDSLTEAQWRMFAGFYNSFNKQKPEVKGIVYREDGETYFRPMDIGSSQRQIFDNWENNIRSNARNGKGPFQGYNKKDKQYNINKAKLAQYRGGERTKERLLTFFNDLGISMTEGIYDRIDSRGKDAINNAANKIFEYLNDRGGLKTLNARLLGISGPLTTISEIYSRAAKPDAESTFQNGDGEQQQTYIQPNYVSQFQSIFNSVSTLEELKRVLPNLKDIFATNSEILRPGGQFFDLEGNRNGSQFSLGYLNATETRARDKVLKDADFPERLQTQLNNILDGTFYISVPADGSTDWYINLNGFVGYNELLSGDNTKINDKMYQYLLDEIALAQEDRSHISNVGNKSNKLRFFKDILSSNNVDRIDRVIAGELNIKDIDRPSLDIDFQNYISQEIAKLMTTLAAEGIVYEDQNLQTTWPSLLNKYIDNYSLPKNKSLREEQFYYVIKQIVVNDFVANTELHKVLFGDPYNFKVKEDALDETKRIKSFLSPAQPSLVSRAYNNKFGSLWATTGTITDYVPKHTITSSTIKDIIIANSLPGYDKVNEADSQAIHSILFHRDLLNRHYRWNKEAKAWMDYELAYTRYDLSERGIDIGDYTPEQKEADRKTLEGKRPEYKISVIKPIVRGMKAGAEFNDAILDKFSSSAIWYSGVKGTNLENLLIKMLREKVDYVILESGRKVGAEGTHSVYSADGRFNEKKFNNKVPVNWDDYSIQTENSYDPAGRQTRGTQITKLFSLDFFEEGKPTDYSGTQEDWDKLPIEEKEKQSEMERMKNANNTILNALTVDGYGKLLDKLGIVDAGDVFMVTNREKLMQTLRSETFKRDMHDNVRDIFKPNKEGEYSIPFEATSEYTKIQKMLYSMADRLILSPTHNGGQRTQLSAIGWENARQGRKLAIKTKDGYKDITKEEFEALTPAAKKKVVFTSSALKFYTREDRVMEVMLPNWFRKRLAGNEKRTDAELLEFLNSTAEGRKILSGIGFRIPTQGMNQIEAFRVKSFLAPEYGDTIVVPSEITTKAGSDFDIDKLNTYLRNIYITDKGEIKLVPYLGTGPAARQAFRDMFLERMQAKRAQKQASLEKTFNLQERLSDILSEKGSVEKREKWKAILKDIFGDDASAVDMEEELMDTLTKLGKDIEKLNDNDFLEAGMNKFSDKMYTASLENAYIDNLEWFVTHEKNFDKLIQPTEGGPLKSIANEIGELTGQKDENKLTNLISVNHLSRLRQQFMSAKKWIGITVNAITSHSQAQRTKLFIASELTPMGQKDKEILKDGSIALPHNTTIAPDGKARPTLSKALDQSGKWISDKLSWYTTAMVDVAKDPYISKIIHNRKLVPTFMFLERIGVPTRTVAMFMNQPIIREYLKFSDEIGFSRLANKYWSHENFLGLNKFPAKEAAEKLDLSSFEKNIEDFYRQKELTEAQNRQQLLVFDEFLKYFKMAEHLFNFTQATNWDTADLKTGGSIFKKKLRTERENAYNIFKTPARILNATQLATIASTMVTVRDAMGSLSRFETPQVRSELDQILETYASLEGYQSQADFEKIDSQITSSFIDYLIQTKRGLNTNIQTVLIDESRSVAARIRTIQNDDGLRKLFNSNPIFDILRAQTSSFDNGADNVVLRPFPKSAYDKDLVTGYLRELKELDEQLYGGIVRLALLQGTGKLNNLLAYVPLEDFSATLSPLIAGNLQEDAAMYRVNRNFERGNWKDPAIVPEATRLSMTMSERYPIERSKMRLHANYPGVIKLTDTYNAGLVPYDVVKVRRTIPIKRFASRYDIVSQQIITSDTMAAMKEKGDFSFLDYVGYQKVYRANGEPLQSVDKNGVITYYYKQVNLMGTGDLQEHYNDGRPSVIDNQTVKVEDVDDDSAIVEAIEGTKGAVPPANSNLSPEEGTEGTC